MSEEIKNTLEQENTNNVINEDAQNIETPKTSTASGEPAPQPNPTPAAPAKKKKSTGKIIAIIAAIVVVLGILGTLLLAGLVGGIALLGSLGGSNGGNGGTSDNGGSSGSNGGFLHTHYYSHGRCSCGDISDAYDALAYYIYQNGTKDEDGDYYISGSLENSYFYIYTNSTGKTLSFRMLSYASDYSSSTYISMDLDKGSTLQEVAMLWEDYYCSGDIYINTFNDTNETIYSFYTDCSYSSLKSSLKELMGSSISLMFTGSNLLISSETDLDISMADLGVTNFD